jgi:hypothetical protein
MDETSSCAFRQRSTRKHIVTDFQLRLAMLCAARSIPPVDHRSSYQLRSLTGAGDNFSRTFDVCGMNRYGPFASLDPSADRVSNPPVLHLKVFRTAAFLGPPPTSCPKLVSKEQQRCDAAWVGGLLAQLLVPRLPDQERLQMSHGRPPSVCSDSPAAAAESWRGRLAALCRLALEA